MSAQEFQKYRLHAFIMLTTGNSVDEDKFKTAQRINIFVLHEIPMVLQGADILKLATSKYIGKLIMELSLNYILGR